MIFIGAIRSASKAASRMTQTVSEKFDIFVNFMVHGSVNHSAVVVNENDDMSRAKMFSGIFDTSELMGADSVACNSYNKKVADAYREYKFGNYF